MEYKIRKITYVNDVYSNLPNTLLHLKTKLDDDISKNQRFNKSVFTFLSCVIYLGAYDIRHFENTERERERRRLYKGTRRKVHIIKPLLTFQIKNVDITD